jgi:thymidylate synthase (FAD)
VWEAACRASEIDYKTLIEMGSTPQEARSVLNNSVKAQYGLKANLREWIHIFSLRCDKTSHPQMQALMRPLFADCMAWLPEVFSTVTFDK